MLECLHMNDFKPLADSVRPNYLAEFVGQEHLAGKDGFVKKLLKNGSRSFPSLIFWGPPGSGKTTLARIIAKSLDVNFREFSAVTAKKSELQKVFDKGKIKPQGGLFSPRAEKPTLVFLDEVHRFSKSQQDVFLGPVESGKIIFVAATTENPSFYVISPLLSRCQTLIFNPLSDSEMRTIVKRGIKELDQKISPDGKKLAVQISNGDARIALNLLEQAGQIAPKGKEIDGSIIEKIVSSTTLRYDKTGEEHYNTISAFIKSIRGSNPDASLYYLARMLKAGEDPLFIARRLVVLASEDVGLANSNALLLANATFKACQTIGLPECEINLAHCVAYLAQSKKSNASYVAYHLAKEDVEKYGNLPVPLKLRNAPTKLMEKAGYGKGYKYAHDYSKKELKEEVYLPDKLKNKKYLKKD